MKFLMKQLGGVNKLHNFIIALIFILSVSWFADGLSGSISNGNPMLLIMLALAFVANISFYCIIRKTKPLSYEMILFVSLIFPILTSSFLGLLLKKFLNNSEALLPFIQLSLSSSAFLIIWLYIKGFKNLKFSVKDVSPKDVRGLVMFLSYWSEPLDAGNFKDFDDLLQGISRCPWEMQLRILNEYKTIRYVYVIGSKSGSYEQIGHFEKFVKRFFNTVEEVIPYQEGIDFEDLEENVKALEEALERLKSKG